MVKTSAIICALLIYIPIFTLTLDKSFSSLINCHEIDRLEGQIISNPVKSDFMGGTYKAVLFCSSSFNGKAKSASNGKVNIYFSSNIIEALYPGKLYTKTDNTQSVLIESGALVSLNVRHIKSGYGESFFVEDIISHSYAKSLIGKIYYFRALCRLNFKRLMYSWGEGGGFLLALLTGSREYTDKKVQNSFIDSGLAHVIALSGMHLSFFGGLASFFGKKLSTKKIAEGIQLGAILFFVWFAGLSPSLFRALLCSLIMFISTICRIKRPSQIDILCICFLIHTMIFPEHLKDAGFMLSYFAMAGILIISPLVSKLFSKRFFPYAARNFSSSLGAQTATSPVSVILFGKIMPCGIISCFILTPLVIIFLYVGITAIILCISLPFLTPLFNSIINIIYKLIRELVFFFALFPVIQIK